MRLAFLLGSSRISPRSFLGKPSSSPKQIRVFNPLRM